jgi:hypothetical protein
MPDFNPLPEFDRGQAALTALRDKVLNAFANPAQTMRGIVDGIGQKHAAHQALDAQAFANPRRPFQVTDQAALGKLAENGLAMLGPAPIGIFAGLASKTLPAKDLMEASSMARKGAPPAEIWYKTGFGKGFDGQWRYEIDDSASNLLLRRHSQDQLFPFHGRGGQLGAMSETFEHPELYKAYPRINTVSPAVRVDPEAVAPGRGHGWYSAGPASANFQGGQIVANAAEKPEAHSIMLHELQHAVQKQQGWQGGGAPELFSVRGMNDHDAYEAYRRIAGEAEARLVQSRQHLTPAERRDPANFPFSIMNFSKATGVHPAHLIDDKRIELFKQGVIKHP